MFLSGVAIAGVLGAGVKVYRDKKREKERPWMVAAERMGKRQKGFLLAKRKGAFSSLVASSQSAVQKVKPEKWPVMFSSLRSEQLKEMSQEGEQEVSEAEKKANKNLALSLVSLGVLSAGTVYPALNLLGICSLAYVWRPFGQKAYKSIIQERRMSIEVLDFATTPLLLAMGYYVITAVAFVVYYISEKMLIKTEDHSRKSLINVFGQQPRSVWVLSDGVEIEVPFDLLKKDDLVVVNAGETIPVDGTITSGMATIDQRILTGESQPAEKGVGSQVFAVTVVLSGKIHVQAQKTGEETVAAHIGQILRNTEDFKAFMRSRGVETADRMVSLRLLLIALALPILGPVGTLPVLNSRFGYYMRIIGPLGMLNFLQLSSRHGILIKDGRSLERLSKVDTVVFDKTGTLTQEMPHVGMIYPCQGYQEEEVLQYAAAAEYKQTHPIALAILKSAKEHDLNLPQIADAKYELGYGIQARLPNKLIRVGSARFMELCGISIPAEMQQVQQTVHEEAYSLVYVAIDDHLGGAIELRPTIRPEAKPMIEYLLKRNMSIVIISGDHEAPTQKLASKLGIEHYFAQTLPENKASIVEQLQNSGQVVCFVGDGINDSIALKKADVSISLRGASTVATDTAQIILMNQTLDQLPQAFHLADQFDAHIKKAFLTSIIPQTLCVGGAFFLHFDILAAVILNQVSLCSGVINAMSPLLTVNEGPISDKTDAAALKRSPSS